MAGGCVRDALLGRVPKDFDVATDATPASIREIFGHRRTLAFGESFGVIGVLRPKSVAGGESRARPKAKIEPTEVATFRSDGSYSDGRRPDTVRFGDMREDAERRDFTINGMFYDPLDDVLHDFVGGCSDIHDKRIRTIGEADRRFDEDKLRMLRAIRFAATLDFEIASETLHSISEHAASLSLVSGERIGAEMRRVFVADGVLSALHNFLKTGLFESTLPFLRRPAVERFAGYWRQLEYRTFETVAALLAINHSSPEVFVKEMNRMMKLSSEEVRRMRAAVERHSELLVEGAPWSTIQPIVVSRDAEFVLPVAAAVGRTEGRGLSTLENTAKRLRDSATPVDPAPLLTGDDLRMAGYSPGPNFREWLNEIRAMQLDEGLHSKDEALEWIENNGFQS